MSEQAGGKSRRERMPAGGPAIADEVEAWLLDYAAAFAALGRGETSPEDVRDRYAVPLLLSTDDVVASLRTDGEVTAWLRSQADAMAAAGYDHTETLSGELAVLNATTATHRAVLSRRRGDGSEIGRMTITYLVVRQPDGLRMAALLVHSAQ
jgi:hypothetical protein